jgi:hypothetical protein
MHVICFFAYLSLVCGQNTTDSPTESPTGAPTWSPTDDSEPATLPPTSLTFDLFNQRNAMVYNFNGNSGYYTYMAFFYLCFTVGPVFLVGFMIARKMYPRYTFAMVPLRCVHVVLMLVGIPLWLIAQLVNLFAPEDVTAFVVVCLIFLIGMLTPLLVLLMFLFPQGKDMEKLAMSEGMVCVTCQAVNDFLALAGLDTVKPSIEKREGVYFGTLSVPEVKTGFGGIIPAETFSSTSVNKSAVKEMLYAQAARHWGNVPAFTSIRNELVREGSSAVTIGAFGATAVAMGGEAIRSGTKVECSHEVSLAIQQGVVRKTPMFDEIYFCPAQKTTVCSFEIKQRGVSDLARAMATGAITVTRTYPMPKESPVGKIFPCSAMGDAVGYLLNGWSASDHKL